MPLLDIQNLTVEFPTRSGLFRAVDSVSLAVDAGETVAIVGESGSGKSVAMLAVMGLLPGNAVISADRMTFDGKDLKTISARERRTIIGRDMSMIFQEPMSSLNPCFTVGFQIKEALRTHTTLRGKALQEKAEFLLAEVGIPEPAKRLSAFPHQMSGGMSQRVMIAMAVACRPKLIIADEPTTALDVTIQAQILDLLLRLQAEEGMALVLITHDMGVVAESSRRVVVQYAGQQVEQANTTDLFADPHHPYTAALMASLPERASKDATDRRLPSIPGVVPGLHDRPSGCLFSPRCSFTTERCRTMAPVNAGADLGRAKCHTPLRHGQPAALALGD